MQTIERSHLAIVEAVARHGSLSAAAQALNLSQSALSHAIAKLEDRLGVLVWRREGRRLIPTEPGEMLLGLARRVLPQFEHAELCMSQFAQGQRGSLRIGMECHPCYQWLLKLVEPYLAQWPDVEVDVKQRFQFGGMGALFAHEIDVLVTPDPVQKAGVCWEPVFDYEQVLVVGVHHRLASRASVEAQDLADEVLISYPVATDRLDLYTYFLTPAGVLPRRRKLIETTDIMLQMVASGRGVAALPRWLVDDYAKRLPIVPLRLGAQGVPKQIFLGIREPDGQIDYLKAFVELAKRSA